jgi:hypothetical protein
VNELSVTSKWPSALGKEKAGITAAYGSAAEVKNLDLSVLETHFL